MLFFAKVIAVLRFSKMKLSTVALLTASLVGASLPTAPRPVVAQSTCDAAVDAVVRDIYERLGIPAQGRVRYEYPLEDTPFLSRNVDAWIALYGGRSKLIDAKVRALTNSPRLRASYARRIFDACPRVAKVNFGYAFGSWPSDEGMHSSWIEAFVVLMPDGSVREGKCFDCGRENMGRNFRWDEMICSC